MGSAPSNKFRSEISNFHSEILAITISKFHSEMTEIAALPHRSLRLRRGLDPLDHLAAARAGRGSGELAERGIVCACAGVLERFTVAKQRLVFY